MIDFWGEGSVRRGFSIGLNLKNRGTSAQSTAAEELFCETDEMRLDGGERLADLEVGQKLPLTHFNATKALGSA